MKISVNLATRPFVELRPFFLRLRIVMGVLAAAAIALGVYGHLEAKKLKRAKEQMAALHNATVAAQQQKNHDESRMHQPANAAVLDRAHFLNALFLRKSFSWTAVMMDLETVLPVGVQVTSIEPQPTPDGDVIIRLRVSGDRDRAIQLVRNLERSKRFLQPRLSGEASQAKENGQGQQPPPGAPVGVEFDILANYNPLPANESYHFAKPQTGTMPTAPAPSTATIRTPAGHVYPQNGVVLKPYVAAPAPKPQPQPQQAQPQLPPGVHPHRPFPGHGMPGTPQNGGNG